MLATSNPTKWVKPLNKEGKYKIEMEEEVKNRRKDPHTDDPKPWESLPQLLEAPNVRMGVSPPKMASNTSLGSQIRVSRPAHKSSRPAHGLPNALCL